MGISLKCSFINCTTNALIAHYTNLPNGTSCKLDTTTSPNINVTLYPEMCVDKENKNK